MNLTMAHTKRSYVAGVLVIFAASYSQYLVHGISPVLDILVVYGVPILVISLLVGQDIAHKSFNQNRLALKFGLSYHHITVAVRLLLSHSTHLYCNAIW